MAFVCAFRGRRDAYQVPIALQEIGQLDLFITDFFSTRHELRAAKLLSKRAADKLRYRYAADLPPGRVKSLSLLACFEQTLKATGVSPERIFGLCDPIYTNAVAARARKTKSDLFLYSPHAWEALEKTYPHDPKKIVFQYHPHFAREDETLRQDAERFRAPALGGLELGEPATDPGSGRWRSDEAWRQADRVVCASSFTRATLVEVGGDPARISVVPYGIDLDTVAALPAGPQAGAFHALFVGTGSQRKGLHHLLTAWSRARLPADARLTIVSRSVRPDMLRMAATVRGVDILKNASGDDLLQLYRTATMFVMPSLVEGFGQVFLEALASGLPVLGTPHTGLPDLGDESDGIFLVTPGALDELVWRLETLARSMPGDAAAKQSARDCAARFSWERFRSGIQTVAGLR